MRHSHHVPGSPAAQADLASLAGWTPSRRGFLGSLLVVTSGTAATVTGSAIALTATANEAPGVSPRMAELVEAYKRETIRIDTFPPDSAEDDFLAAQIALMNEPPANMADYAAKFDALMEVETADGEFALLQRLSDDAHALAKGAR